MEEIKDRDETAKRVISLFLSVGTDGGVRMRGCLPDRRYHETLLRPSHRTVRVAVRASVKRGDWVRQLAGIFAESPDEVEVGETLNLLPHELNAPFGASEGTLVYRCVVKSQSKYICHLSQDSKDIALIDLMPNVDGESPMRPLRVSDKDVLVAEAELLGLTTPCWLIADTTKCRTLSEAIESVAPLRPEETMRYLGVAFATRKLASNDRSAFYGLKPSTAQPSPEKFGAHNGGGGGGEIFIVHGKNEEPSKKKKSVGILLVPAREYGFFENVTDRYFSPYHYSSVVCYEALLARLYGSRYRLQVPGSDGYTPNADVITRAYTTAIKAGFYTGASLIETFSGGQIRMACCLAQKSYTRAGIFPPPRYARSVNRKRSNTQNTKSYEGGAILPASAGIHQTSASLCDFDSHYPSIICEYSLAPEVYGSTDDRQESDGPTAEMSDLIDKKRKERDPIEKKALKLGSVTYYGAHGTVHSPIFSTKIAAAITEHGRRLLGQANERLVANGGDVVFGHTDSVTEIGVDTARVDSICRTFNDEFRKVRLEREKTFDFLWIFNRTTYIGRLSGASTKRPVGFFYDSIERDIGEICRTHSTDPDPPGIMDYMKTRQAVAGGFSRILKAAKEHLVFPGLISSVRPIIMNVLALLLASFCVDICSSEDAEAEAHGAALRERLESFLKLLCVDESTIYPCSVPAWTYEFPLASRDKARRGASENARLSRTIWCDIEKRSKNLSFEAQRMMTEHLKVHCLEDPEKGSYLVDLEAVRFPLNKYKWISQVYRTWCGYTRDLSANGYSIHATRIRQLLAPLECLCSQNPHLHRLGSRKKLSSGLKSRAVGAPPGILGVPENIQEVRSIIAEWVSAGGSCPAKTEAEEQLKLARQHLQKIVGLKDQKSRLFSLSLLCSRLDANEALLMTVNNFELLETARSDVGFQSHVRFYRNLLENWNIISLS